MAIIIFSCSFTWAHCPLPGFMTRGDLKPKPSLYYPEVGYVSFPVFLFQCAHSTKRRDGSPIMAQFNTVLRAYITPDYQENAILREPIATFELWSHDLAALPENTTWNLKYDSSSGRYTIVQAWLKNAKLVGQDKCSIRSGSRLGCSPCFYDMPFFYEVACRSYNCL